MILHSQHSRGLARGIRLTGGLPAMTASATVFLTDPLISSSLWPGSFHQRVVQLLGGSVRASATGQPEVLLDAVSVGWRLLLTLVVLAGLSSMLTSLRNRSAAATSASGVQRWPLFVYSCERVCGVWLWTAVWLALWVVSDIWPDSLVARLLYLTPTFCLAAVGAATLQAAWPPEQRPLDAAVNANSSSGSVLPVTCLAAATVVWIGVSFWMNERLYAGLWIPHGDSAMYEEHLWNVWHGKGFRSYLDQGLFLGEHLQVIHLLLLPLHMLWPSHLLLELAESISLGICVIPVYSLARRHSGSSTAAAWLAGAWLLYYPMHFLDIAVDLKTLRPSCYGLPFLFWGLDLAERHRLRAASLCLVLALSAQEDFALIIGPAGFVLWWLQRSGGGQDPQARRTAVWGLGVGCLSVIYVLSAVLLIIPAFRGGAAVHYSRYFGELGSSPGDLVRTTLQDPGRVLGQLLTTRTLLYVLAFSVPLGGLVFRSPVRLLAGAATFVMLSLIQLSNSADPASAASELPPVPYHHFHAPLLPVLFWAAAAGLRLSGQSQADGQGRGAAAGRQRLRRQWLPADWSALSPTAAARSACCCALLTAVTSSLMPCGAAFWSPESRTSYERLFVPGRRAAEFRKVLPQLPLSSRVASTDYVHTRLTHYERSYDYSGYLRAVNNYQPGVPADTDYIVIDTQHPYSTIRSPQDVPELQQSPDAWELLPDQTNGYFIVLKRRR